MRTITIPTRHSDFNGLVNLEFVDEKSQQVKRIENVDVILEYDSLNKSIGDDEQTGTPFLRAVARYIFVTHGVEINIWAAQTYYDTLAKILGDATNFFTSPPDSPDSTDSTQDPSPPENSQPTTTSSEDCEQKSP